MNSKNYYIYIMANNRPTLYSGVTNDLPRRAYKHKNNQGAGFTSGFNLNKLVYYQQTDSPRSAIEPEKRLKHWNREWQLRLIQARNPDLRDLSQELVG